MLTFSCDERVQKKPTFGDPPGSVMSRRKWLGEGNSRNPMTGWSRPPRPKPKPKPVKTEIDLYLERIGYDRR